MKSNSTSANLLAPFISSEIGKQLRNADLSFAEVEPIATEAAIEQRKTFDETFSVKRTIQEAPSIATSSDANWWVNSGGELIVDKGVARTLQGAAAEGSRWREIYKKTTQVDTDTGAHPQNIFRLVLKNKWLNYSQQVYAKVVKDNLSESPQRDDSNGLFLFNRYYDGDNIYYTGLRVDGAVSIKKKYKGAYYTLLYKKILNVPKYGRADNPNVLPKDTWMGIKSVVRNLDANRVEISFYTDIGEAGTWKLGGTVIDDNKSFGGAALLRAGYAGIRTDFMDVQFKKYAIADEVK
ncbi:MAG: hypothetical protein M3Q44_07610 [bacterium]|nr:hypothetical protein [bacterium]